MNPAKVPLPLGRRVRDLVLASGLVWPGVLTGLALLAVLAFAWREQAILAATAGACAIATLGWAAYALYRSLLYPLAELQNSLARVCQGEPQARIQSGGGAIADLVADVEALSEELSELYDDMDDRVERQTRRLAQKTASLKILYEVAASVNHADDLDGLLLRYLRNLKEMVGGLAASVRLRDADGRLRIVGSIDLDGRLMREQEMLPLALCRCGSLLVPGDILCQKDARQCSERNGRPMYGPDRVERIEVPLAYHGTRLGAYWIYVQSPGIAGREDVLDLLSTIGSHLGMAVAKQRSDAEARRLSIIEERNHLAHELHDSLAQTLASLRFQVRMLQDTLAGENGPAAAEVERLRNGLDEAHTELRELLDNFRAPLDRRGLVPALEKLAQGFRQETGIATFFQRDCRQPDLSAQEEMQMLRIVQEALTNIRKHAAAHTVRILLRCRRPGAYLLLVEDDGRGFVAPRDGGRPGEHIGLSIMEERARNIGARLRLESEPGEGTRVEVVFRPGGRLSGAGLA